MEYKLPPLPTFEEWCRIISPSEPGTQIASVENFVKAYAIAAVEAQGVPEISTEHGPWVASNIHEGETYCKRCLLRSAFLGAKACEPHIKESVPPAPQAKPQPLSADRDARIADLEQRNTDLYEDVQRFKQHALNEKAARLELERQLEEARKDAERWRTFLSTRPQSTHEVIIQAIDDAAMRKGQS